MENLLPLGVPILKHITVSLCETSLQRVREVPWSSGQRHVVMVQKVARRLRDCASLSEDWTTLSVNQAIDGYLF